MRMINRGKGLFCSRDQTCFQSILFITHHAFLVKTHYVALQQCLVALWPKRQNKTLDTVGFKRCGPKVSQKFMELKQKKTIWPKTGLTSYKNLKVHFIYSYLSCPLKVMATRQWCCLKIDKAGCHCFLNFVRYTSTFNRKTLSGREITSLLRNNKLLLPENWYRHKDFYLFLFFLLSMWSVIIL